MRRRPFEVWVQGMKMAIERGLIASEQNQVIVTTKEASMMGHSTA